MRPALILALPVFLIAGCASHVQKTRHASTCYPLSCAAPAQSGVANQAAAAEVHRVAVSLPGTDVSVEGHQMRMRRVNRRGMHFAVFSDSQPFYSGATSPDMTHALLRSAPQLTGCAAAPQIWRSTGAAGADYTVQLSC